MNVEETAEGTAAAQQAGEAEGAGRSEHGATMAAISRRIVHLLKEYYGKGPTKARTFHWGELVVVLLSGGFTRAEKTLLEEGRERAVIDQRAELQSVMRPRFKRVIEEELNREVIAFMSANHHDPDFNAELFILAALPGENGLDATAEESGEGC
jgi:uncharacterized protein YbcI